MFKLTAILLLITSHALCAPLLPSSEFSGIGRSSNELAPSFDTSIILRRQVKDHYCRDDAPEQHWNYARRDYLMDGFTYLATHRGTCDLKAHECQRVSCSHDAGIFVCNNTNDPISRTWQDVTNLAWNIMLECGSYADWSLVAGQWFDNVNMDVIIKKSHC